MPLSIRTTTVGDGGEFNDVVAGGEHVALAAISTRKKSIFD